MLKKLRNIIPRALNSIVIKAKKKELNGPLTHGAMRHYALGGSPVTNAFGTRWDKEKKKRVLKKLGEGVNEGFWKDAAKAAGEGIFAATNPFLYAITMHDDEHSDYKPRDRYHSPTSQKKLWQKPKVTSRKASKEQITKLKAKLSKPKAAPKAKSAKPKGKKK
jgi:hypothetical protein